MRGELTINFETSEEECNEISMFLHMPQSKGEDDILNQVVDMIMKEKEGYTRIIGGEAALEVAEQGIVYYFSFTFKDEEIECQTVH